MHPLAADATRARLYLDGIRSGRWGALRLLSRRPGWVRLDPEPPVTWRILA